MLAFTSAAQLVMPWIRTEESTPKQAKFKAWTDHVCATALPSQKDRRHLFWALLVDAWMIANWLTQAKPSTWYDAEAATSTVEHAFGSLTSYLIGHK